MAEIRGFRSLGGPYNLPDDVSPNHPHFNPPDPVACENPDCNEEVWPGEECEGCGTYQMTVDEHRAEAEIEAAEAQFDMDREDGRDEW